MKSFIAIIVAVSQALPARAAAPDRYAQVISRTAAMVGDRQVRSLAEARGLRVLDLTWEDTGRSKDSSVGPNISDMTIQVQNKGPNGDYGLTLMPVIRYDNFSDKSADVSPDKFFLLTGNEKGRELERVTLRSVLKDPRKYLSRPRSWKGERTSLLAERDTHVLVSAQACFLPVPRDGVAEFNPVLFNYQSYAGDPAVLTILATREGTSVTVIDNARDGFQAGPAWGQRLFFNHKGERASLTGTRLSDFHEAAKPSSPAGPSAGEEGGLNMVLLIQVPLKQKNPRASHPYLMESFAQSAGAGSDRAAAASDVEEAVIGHGKVEGPFTEIADLDIERDPRYPVRVTVQFYKATSNGVVSRKDMDDIAAQIARVYKDADYVGSLVVSGETGRPTEHTGPKAGPFPMNTQLERRRGEGE